MELLTLADVEDVKGQPYCTSLELLSLIGERARQLHGREENNPDSVAQSARCPALDISKRRGKYSLQKSAPKVGDGDFSKRKRWVWSSSLNQSTTVCGPVIDKGKRIMTDDEKPYNALIDKGKGIVIDVEKPYNAKRKHHDKEVEEEEDWDERKEKKRAKLKGMKKVNSFVDEGPIPRPGLREEFMALIRELNGSDVKLVIQKMITVTDTSHGHNRLSIPLRRVLEPDFLNSQEESTLKLREEGKLIGIHVPILIEPSLDTSTIIFKRWDMEKKNAHGKTSSSYALCRPWNDVRDRNGLLPGMLVQLWSFRSAENDLCFALVNLTPRKKGQEMGGGSGKNEAVATTSGAASTSRPTPLPPVTSPSDYFSEEDYGELIHNLRYSS